MVTAPEQRVLDQIDMDGLLTTLDGLVQIRSLAGPEENHAQEYVAAVMREFGMDVDLWDIDFATLSQHPAYSAEIDRQHGLGLIGSWGGENGHTLALNGHVDVVPVGYETLWSFDPWRATVHDGNVYGRGTLDMKGALCCGLYAVRAIQQAGVKLRGKVMIQSVIGEEDGGCGTLAAVLRGPQADAAIVMEPTELMVSPAQAGALNFRVKIPGQSAHGAMRNEGVSALEKMIHIYEAIMRLEARRNTGIDHPMFRDYELPYPICVGTVHGGDWASNPPESVTIEGRYGVAVDEDLAHARAELESAIAEAAQSDPFLRDHAPQLTWWGAQFAPASIDSEHILVQVVSDCCEAVSGSEPIRRGMPYGADMRLLVNDGKMSTLMFGPGDVRKAHRPDEYVPLADLRAAAQTYALTVMRLCGVEA